MKKPTAKSSRITPAQLVRAQEIRRRIARLTAELAGIWREQGRTQRGGLFP